MGSQTALHMTTYVLTLSKGMSCSQQKASIKVCCMTAVTSWGLVTTGKRHSITPSGSLVKQQESRRVNISIIAGLTTDRHSLQASVPGIGVNKALRLGMFQHRLIQFEVKAFHSLSRFEL